MEWMYKQDYDQKHDTVEEYLLGKPVEDQFLEKKKEHVFQEEIGNEKNNQFLKLYEDPLFHIKKKELEEFKKMKEKRLIEGPLAERSERNRKIEKLKVREVLQNYHQKHMGNFIKLDLRNKKLVDTRPREEGRKGSVQVVHPRKPMPRA